MKKIIFLYLLFTFFIPRHILAQNCELAFLVDDLSSLSTEFKAIVSESNGLEAWESYKENLPTIILCK